MSKASSSAVLPFAQLSLRILIVINWIGAALLVVLLVALPNEQWIMRALKLDASPDAATVVLALRSIAVLGLAVMVLHYVVMSRLVDMIATVRDGDPFVAVNAQRLQTIAWTLLALQAIGLVIQMIGKMLSTSGHPVNLNAGFSFNGFLAVVLTFVLARVFAHGSLMRDDLEGTV